MLVTEQHPWNWYGQHNSKTLIVGTFPPTQHNWSFDFFYPNKRNLFWKVIATILNRPFIFETGTPAVNERKEALDQLQISITDMGKAIQRTAGNSLDENLHPVAFMDIFSILEEQPMIDTIIFTSSSGKVSAAKWFEDYCIANGIFIKLNKAPKPAYTYMEYHNRMIKLVVLYSPSAPAANRIDFDSLVDLYKNEIIRS